MSLVVLLTDFGTRDYFVGVMRGVISQINPILRVIDLTHEIEPQNVRQAAFVLWASRRSFPEDSIFVCVVDPGVGSDRKVICGRIGGQIFLAPDNGLLDYVVAESKEIELYEVTNRKLFGSTVSSTFHGRDIMAPVAAHLSRGTKLNELGDRFNYRSVVPFYRKLEKGKNNGEIVYRDRFGNVLTNFLWQDSLLSGTATINVKTKVITKFCRTYSEANPKTLACVKGSSGLVEIAVNSGDASKLLKSKIGQKVTLVWK
jgi:S-adenosylmethionine hydrolase